MLRHDWTEEEVKAVYEQAFPDLIYQAQSSHRENFSSSEIQRATLLSIKTGACSEDCGYCAQSGHYKTEVERQKLLTGDVVINKAREAKESGSTRFCMGAAWRGIRNTKDFDRVLEIVRGVNALGLEVCCTLGMLTLEQAKRLREAGCHTYNHNLDTSPEHYPSIVSTHSYQDRLNTLHAVREAGMKVCCGGILGMGENREDRIKLLLELANQQPHPASVPINMLIPMEGTPLAGQPRIDPLEYVRTVATARIIMPRSYVRLAAGRTEMSDEMQALCLAAGANSIFAGEKLLTAPNPGEDKDGKLLKRLGMTFLKDSPAVQEEETEYLVGNAG